MLRYIIKRLLLMIPVLIGVSMIVYFISGSNTAPIMLKLGGEELTKEEYAALEHELGFDRPLIVRYVEYMSNVLRGDMGKSYITGESVFQVYLKKLPVTLWLASASVLVCILISIPLGIISALKNGSLVDNGSMVLALLGLSIPNYWLGLLLIIAFSLKLKWFPSGGYRDGIRSFILPAITVGTGMTASLTRQTRSSMLDVLRADYLRTARAKGVPERRVILRHALRNALIPIITVIGGEISTTLAGSVLTETVFALPGVGRQLVDAINNMDVNMVTGFVTLKAMVSATIHLLVDLLYAFVDPRIKAQFAAGGKKRG